MGEHKLGRARTAALPVDNEGAFVGLTPSTTLAEMLGFVIAQMARTECNIVEFDFNGIDGNGHPCQLQFTARIARRTN